MTAPRPLRVLHCRQGERMWGAERQILQLLSHLDDYGVQTELVLLRRWGLDPEPHPLAVAARDAGCAVWELSARPQETLGVLRFLRQRLQACDLLHTHEFKGDLLGWPAARLALRPWIATDHHLSTDDEALLKLFGYADRWALGHADAVIVPSHSQALRLNPKYGDPHARIHVIPHGIAADAFAQIAGDMRAATRQRFGAAPEQPVVAAFGRLELVKGHGDLLLAAQRVLAVQPQTRFWIVGEGSLATALQQQALALGISESVQFLGYHEVVAPLMAAADLILLPSHYESFGLVLIEAMSLAKPIIASAAGGIPEVVLDGEHGYLAPPGNPRLLAERILDMLHDPERARRLGAAGRERVRQLFTVEAMVARTAEVYQQVAGSTRASRPASARRSHRISARKVDWLA